ncbi:MAG: sigma-54-dependent Fis family transcriptional regulator [Planctomycetes bacterium]|nr:sigma-54-dependent Fis family transcriptional regulator [Planctomycetota bacterium]
MNERAVIMVVEDNSSERDALARVLRLEGYEILTARNPEEALKSIHRAVDLVISDLRLGTKSGIDLLKEWVMHQPATAFIMVTAYGDVQTAVEAMKCGARDYLTKPVDPKRLLELVHKHCVVARAAAEASTRRSPGRGVKRLIGESQIMLRVAEQIDRAAKTDSTVLILGESGSGKELVADAIHNGGRRSNAPFVVVNMAAIPETLVESELFGHVRGSFTGATADRLGRFEQAKGGTLFIDEIGDFPIGSQAKLLRALETRQITPIGGNDLRPVDVRVVAATSRDLATLMQEGKFREDLYYRLHVVAIGLPPLRQRREDIAELTEYFLEEISQRLQRPRPRLHNDLRFYLEQYDWPGNVRQLRNCIESMLVLNDVSVLTLEHLPASMTQLAEDQSAETDEKTLTSVEKNVILQTLDRCHGNRTHAAATLGISVRTLQRRLKEWAIEEQSQ